MPTIQELVTDNAHPIPPLEPLPSTPATPFYFDATISRYKTCCGCMKLTTCSRVIGIVEIVVMVFFLIDAILIWLRAGSAHSMQLGFCVAGVILGLVAVMLLFLSLSWDKPHLLIPHVVMQAVAIILLLILSVLCIVALVAGTSVLVRIVNRSDVHQDSALSGLGSHSGVSESRIVSSYMQITLIAFMLLFLLVAMFEIWAISVVLRTLQFLKMKNRYKKIERNGRVLTLDPIRPLHTQRLKGN